jgi:short subunit dehydrogenase-like uncharacterized protein
MERRFDVVLFGATGYTGRLVAAYLARRHGAELRWAVAGRSADKLARVKAELGLDGVETLIADSADGAALAEIARSTKVVCTTVGPYAVHGGPLAAACAEAGTHYCDLTGEVPFMRACIDANDAKARATGARIVHTCGFDSIPSDLGVWMLHEHFQAQGTRLRSAALFVGPAKGGFSGGTLTSLLGVLSAAAKDPAVRRLVGDPYALAPDRAHDRGPDGGDQLNVRFEPKIGAWTGPFLMASVNTRVVRRTNALLENAYGRDFRYSEAMSFGPGPRGFLVAFGVASALGLFVATAALQPGRALLGRVLPAPGTGPTPEQRDAGFFRIRILGEGENGARAEARVVGTSDPGYGETAKMLGESAVCLAKDDLPPRAGVLTPASAMGTRLIERLRAAGMTFEVG